MNEKAIVTFADLSKNREIELEIPLNITANDLIIALNHTFQLGMDTENIFSCYLIAENPVAFLKGNRLLSEFQVRNGTRIIFKRG